jgi:hypothetical protein
MERREKIQIYRKRDVDWREWLEEDFTPPLRPFSHCPCGARRCKSYFSRSDNIGSARSCSDETVFHFSRKSLFRRLSIDRHSPFVTVVFPEPGPLKTLASRHYSSSKTSIGLARSLPWLNLTREKGGGFNEHRHSIVRPAVSDRDDTMRSSDAPRYSTAVARYSD